MAIVTIPITGIIGLLIAKYFDIRQTKLNNLITRALETGGIAKFRRDAKGNARGGLIHENSVRFDAKFDTKGSFSTINDKKE